MNDLTIWNYQGNNGRTLVIDNEPWFVGKDICEMFGDTNYRRSLSKLDEDEKGMSLIHTLGGSQEMIIINESGMYSLLFHMQPQKAKGVSQNEQALQERIENLHRFKRWVTHEVLPEIRRTGSYASDKQLDYPENEQLEVSLNVAKRILAISKREAKEFCALAIQKQYDVKFPLDLRSFKIERIDATLSLQDRDTDGFGYQLDIIFRAFHKTYKLTKFRNDVDDWYENVEEVKKIEDPTYGTIWK